MTGSHEVDGSIPFSSTTTDPAYDTSLPVRLPAGQGLARIPAPETPSGLQPAQRFGSS